MATNGLTNGLTNGVINGETHDVTNGLTNGLANGLANGVINGETDDETDGLANGLANGVINGETNGNGVISGPTNSPSVISGPTHGLANGVTRRSSRAGIGDSVNPFIRRHATDLVDWHLLDDEAVDMAKAENKVIFMHIGFSACHFCRLTTEESFNHGAVANLLNSHFVPVIVDRDERPDLNQIYQTYYNAVNPGAGSGWPLHVFLTPELMPIYGGKYWPGPGTERSGGDFDDFLMAVQKVLSYWQEQEHPMRLQALHTVSKLAEFEREGVRGDNTFGDGSQLVEELDLDLLEEAVVRIAQNYDVRHGGFGEGPKHPMAPRLSFLLRLQSFPQEARDVVDGDRVGYAYIIALHTLRRIRDGGLRDHAGRGGFHRYSRTNNWGHPGFEKMVAENALLLGAFLDAWLLEAKSAPRQELEFADVVLELADYLIRPPICLSGGKCGFATSEASDSSPSHGDSHMRQGGYYLWTLREFDAVVGYNNGEYIGSNACKMAEVHFGVREEGNVPRAQDPHDEYLNQNVLQITGPAACVPALASHHGVSEDEVRSVLSVALRKLRTHRARARPRPAVDVKAVAAINGMVIGALARTAAAVQVFDGVRSWAYLDAAREAAEFVRREMWDADHRTLYRIFSDGRRGTTCAFADDYAFMIEGVLDLAEALNGSVYWFDWARELQDRQVELFHDSIAGGFFTTESHAPHNILRLKEGLEPDRPSINAVSAENLWRLSGLSGSETYEALARGTINAFEPEMLQFPWCFPGLLTAVVAGRLGVLVDAHWGIKPRAQARVGRVYGGPLSGPGATVPWECFPS